MNVRLLIAIAAIAPGLCRVSVLRHQYSPLAGDRDAGDADHDPDGGPDVGHGRRHIVD
jgi:hypothetical protein